MNAEVQVAHCLSAQGSKPGPSLNRQGQTVASGEQGTRQDVAHRLPDVLVGQAETALRGCIELSPEDGPSLLFLDRVRQLRAQPPGEDQNPNAIAHSAAILRPDATLAHSAMVTLARAIGLVR